MTHRTSTLIKSSIAVTAVLALFIWCISRWNTWFHNPDEAPYEPSSVPSRVLLTFGDADGKNRNVSWTCGKEVEASYIELYDTKDRHLSLVRAEGESFKSRSGKAAYYVGRLRHLKYGHHYSYRVCTGAKKSAWHRFSLPAKDEKDISFIYAGDIQDTIGGCANNLLRQSFKANPDAQFLICGGDLTERPTDAFWQETFCTLDSIGQSIPVITAAGNHEYLKGVICQLDRRFTLTHSYYLDSKVDDNQLFTVKVGDAQIFVLDSNREFFYLFTQARWLKQQLEASQAKWKILVLHHPLYSLKGNMNNIIQRWMFDDYVRDNGVDLVLQGHEHAYGRMTAHDDNQRTTTPVYTVSHCSPKSYRIELDGTFDKYGVGGRYLQKVRTHGDTLFMAAYNAYDNSLYDSLYVVKDKRRHGIVHDCGKHIREVLMFDGDPKNKKDKAFMERIATYAKSHNCIVK